LLEAKIIEISDVVEAMSSHRPYRPALGIDAALEEISKNPALGIDAALEEISKNRGILYDPKIVDVYLKLFKKKEGFYEPFVVLIISDRKNIKDYFFVRLYRFNNGNIYS